MDCTIYCCNYKNVSDAFNALQKIASGTIRKDKLATWERISFFLEPGFTIHAKCTPQEPEGYYDVEFYAEVCGNKLDDAMQFIGYLRLRTFEEMNKTDAAVKPMREENREV